MVLDSVITIVSDKNISKILAKFTNEQQELLKSYLQDYNRKLQLLDAFSQQWTQGHIDRLKEVMQELTKINFSETELVQKENSDIQQALKQLTERIKIELDQRKKQPETKIAQNLNSLLNKLKILEKNISFQVNWFHENKSLLEKNAKKSQLINLIRREGEILFDINSTDIKEVILQTNYLLQLYDMSKIRADTAEICAEELHKELAEFEKDRAGLVIEETSKLSGGFTNEVVLVKTNDKCEYVAKAFRPEGEFKLSMHARKFIVAAGGLVAPLIRVSKNEIICEKVEGKALLDILISQPTVAPSAFYTFGKSLAIIHKNTIQELSTYDPRAIVRNKYNFDYLNLQKRMKKFLQWKVITKNTYNQFIKTRKKYYPTYLSIIVSDVNLTNYFYVKNPETIIIIDYDYAKPGDPLTDVGRIISSIRYQCFRSKSTPKYTDILVQSFIAGYKSILNIELRGVDLYNLIIYSIIINSSKPLLDKISQLQQENSEFAQKFTSLEDFFNGKYLELESYFNDRERNKIREVQYSLQQINKFIEGKEIAIDLAEMKLAA